MCRKPGEANEWRASDAKQLVAAGIGVGCRMCDVKNRFGGREGAWRQVALFVRIKYSNL